MTNKTNETALVLKEGNKKSTLSRENLVLLLCALAPIYRANFASNEMKSQHTF